MSDIIIYESAENQTKVEIRFEGDSFWVNQYQLAELFQTDRTSILKHLQKIFADGELEEAATCAKFAQVRREGKRTVKREVLHYNLDVIISVGYRVNSKKGTQFRQWATQRLNDYFVKGFTLNESRLNQMLQHMQHLEETVTLIKQSGNSEQLNIGEARGLLDVLTNYTRSFILLNRYDSNNLCREQLTEYITYEIKYNEEISAISALKAELIAAKEASNLFGIQKDESFAGILGNVVQTFGGIYLYPTIDEQAAHLLYFIIKNHPFTDGNKRIGAFLFVWFLEKNRYSFKSNGELKINDNALTALALLVAQSNPTDKDIIIALITNLTADAKFM